MGTKTNGNVNKKMGTKTDGNVNMKMVPRPMVTLT